MLENATQCAQETHREIKVGHTYRHYSGKKYKVITIARDSENPFALRVIYQALYACPTFGLDSIWDRPYEMFAQKVTINGIEQYRFEDITEYSS